MHANNTIGSGWGVMFTTSGGWADIYGCIARLCPQGAGDLVSIVSASEMAGGLIITCGNGDIWSEGWIQIDSDIGMITDCESWVAIGCSLVSGSGRMAPKFLRSWSLSAICKRSKE